MFSTCIKESKALPDFSASDDYEVSLVLSGVVRDEQFLRFLARVGAETLASFNSGDFLLLDAINRDLPVPTRLHERLPKLLELGIIERQAHGRSHLLSQRFYQFAGRSGAYTRRKGLDKETNKELLLKHIKRNKAEGSPLRDLQEVLPNQSRQQIQRLLAELTREEKAFSKGKTRGARWYPVTPEPKERQP